MRSEDWTAPFGLNTGTPHLADYFGIWSVYSPAFDAIVSRCQGMNLLLHVQEQQAKQAARGDDDDDEDGFEMTPEGIALFMVSGPMMKARSSMSGGTSTVALRRQINQARRNPMCRGGMLLLDTPGGTAKGNADLADDVAAFAAAKPCMAFVEDMCASAGVSIASQCPTRYANTAACLYGAMGTYSVLTDSSKAADKLGIKVHVVRAGEYKGMGEPGTELKPAYLDEAQRVVNLLNDQYLALIARGTGMPMDRIRELADGRIHSAADATAMGLIQGIRTFDAAYAELLTLCSPTGNRGSKMTTEKQAATLAELKQTFPKSSAEWREEMIEMGASLSDAAIAYAQHVEAQSEAKMADLQEKLDKAGKAAPVSLGHRPLTLSDAGHDLDTGDAREDFEAAVSRVAGQRPSLERRQSAIRAVARKNPALYQAYLLATNSGGGKVKERMLSDKIDQLNTDPHCRDYAVKAQ